MFFALARRVGLVLVCGVLAVLGAPSAGAQEEPPHPPYTLKTQPADVSHLQNGDSVRITLSGLPAFAQATIQVCPANMRDALVKKSGTTWVADHDLGKRVAAYCRAEIGDELTGLPAHVQGLNRMRGAADGNIVFDATIPRGTTTPAYVSFDPDYTNLNYQEGKYPWPNNPIVSTDPVTNEVTRLRKFSYSCDENNPCTLMLRIDAANPDGSQATWYDSSLSFAPAAPGLTVKGCAGLGANTLNASVPARFGGTAVSWNQLMCAPTHAEQPANIVSENEDTALTSFDTGASDVAVTGSGGTLATQTVRSRQYLPLGLNAMVLAAVGWSPIGTSDDGSPLISRVPDAFSFTFDELANMMTKGGENPGGSGRGGIFADGSPLVSRNPAMATITGLTGPAGSAARAGQFTTDFFGLTAEAGKGTVPLAMSQVLTKAAPGAWVFPKVGDPDYYGALDGKSPGVITDLGALDPGKYRRNNVDAKVGPLAVRKVLDDAIVGNGVVCANGCLNWIVTDLATANAYGWTPVAVPDGKGGYVKPTTQSLQTAAAGMKEGPDGTLQPGTVPEGAYPFTFAEYLAVPTNPLIDATCKLLPGKQDQLKKFARMAGSSAGQGSLAPGLAPLTPALSLQTVDRAADIGTGSPEKACQEKEEAKDPPPPGSSAAGTGVTNASASNTALTTTPAAETGAVPEATAAPTAASVLAAKNLADTVRIPPFAGAGVLGALVPLLALVILATLPSLTAYATAGRPVPSWLGKAVAALGGLFARIGRAK